MNGTSGNRRPRRDVVLFIHTRRPMKSLAKKVAVVTGASRGVGKGIALGLGEAGATVYVTGRTTQEGTDIDKLGGTVLKTAEEVTAMGGKGIAVTCDHREDAQVEKVFQ